MQYTSLNFFPWIEISILNQLSSLEIYEHSTRASIKNQTHLLPSPLRRRSQRFKKNDRCKSPFGHFLRPQSGIMRDIGRHKRKRKRCPVLDENGQRVIIAQPKNFLYGHNLIPTWIYLIRTRSNSERSIKHSLAAVMIIFPAAYRSLFHLPFVKCPGLVVRWNRFLKWQRFQVFSWLFAQVLERLFHFEMRFLQALLG